MKAAEHHELDSLPARDESHLDALLVEARSYCLQDADRCQGTLSMWLEISLPGIQTSVFVTPVAQKLWSVGLTASYGTLGAAGGTDRSTGKASTPGARLPKMGIFQHMRHRPNNVGTFAGSSVLSSLTGLQRLTD